MGLLQPAINGPDLRPVAAPGRETRQRRAPGRDLDLEIAGGGLDLGAPDHGNDCAAGHNKVIHPDEQGCAPDRVQLAPGRALQRIVAVVAPPRVASPPGCLARDPPRREPLHEPYASGGGPVLYICRSAWNRA